VRENVNFVYLRHGNDIIVGDESLVSDANLLEFLNKHANKTCNNHHQHFKTRQKNKCSTKI